VLEEHAVDDGFDDAQGHRLSAPRRGGQRGFDSDHGAHGQVSEWLQSATHHPEDYGGAAGRVAAVMVGELVEAADRWVVPMAGRAVTQCRMDHAFSLVVADEPDGSFEVRIEQPFILASEGQELTIDPEGDPVQNRWRDTQYNGGFGLDFTKAPQRGRCATLVVKIKGRQRPLRTRQFRPDPGRWPARVSA
jgi:hypothetical protein